jgi:type VI secretion system secreted protein Hcp
MSIINFFLKIDGVQGESTDKVHKGEIDVLSWSWGASNRQANPEGGPTGPHLDEFVFTHKIDAASPKLLVGCASGKPISTATLTVRKGGKTPAEYYTIKLDEILISSVQQSGHGGDSLPAEEVSLNFAKIEIEYEKIRSDGTLGPPIIGSFGTA